MPFDHLRLADMSDREVLLIMIDLADEDGLVDPLLIAETIGVRGDNKRRAVTARLSWLKRWGAVYRDNDTRSYGLTAIGHDMASGALRAAQSKALEGMGDAQMLLVTQWLTERAHGSGTTVQTLVRREWQYRTQFARNGRR